MVRSTLSFCAHRPPRGEVHVVVVDEKMTRIFVVLAAVVGIVLGTWLWADEPSSGFAGPVIFAVIGVVALIVPAVRGSTKERRVTLYERIANKIAGVPGMRFFNAAVGGIAISPLVVQVLFA